jgi:hypothetical protein
MSRGARWHRAGRGACEIHGVELGSLLRVSVHLDAAATGGTGQWRAFMNLGGLGVHDSFAEAQAQCDAELRLEARRFIEDWETYVKLYPVAFQASQKRQAT